MAAVMDKGAAPCEKDDNAPSLDGTLRGKPAGLTLPRGVPLPARLSTTSKALFSTMIQHPKSILLLK